jgi:hypothetical protein
MLKVMKMVEAMLILRVEEARPVNQSNADDWDVDHEGKDLRLKVTALKCFSVVYRLIDSNIITATL